MSSKKKPRTRRRAKPARYITSGLAAAYHAACDAEGRCDHVLRALAEAVRQVRATRRDAARAARKLWRTSVSENVRVDRKESAR